MKSIRIAIILAFATALSGCGSGAQDSDVDSGASQGSSISTSATPAISPTPAIPEKEQWLTDLTYTSKKNWEQAQESNPLVSSQQVADANQQFDAQICRFANTLHVTDWVGSVYELGIPGQDESKGAYISVNLLGKPSGASDSNVAITLTGWMTDRGDNDDSLVAKPGTALFESLKTLKKGDIVAFDGDFQKIDGPGCLRTNSDLETPSDNARAADDRPTYLFKFTKVSPAQ